MSNKITSYVLQAWNLHERGELESLVDISLDGDFNVEEALRFCKIGLLCIQDSLHLRPSMSSVLDMLVGKTHVNEERMTKPGLIFGFVEANEQGKQKGKAKVENTSSFAGSGNQDDSSLSGSTYSLATMTFTSLYDRSN